MTVTMEECYQALDGNYAEASTRFPNSRLIEKFIGKFLEDPSFETLCAQMKAGNRPEAFRCAHTLKGVCANLGFSRLLKSAGQLTDELRAETATIPDTAVSLLEDVRHDYQITVDAICRYLDMVKQEV